ncbi:MAG TPA: helix-hairpin-helix domain-containing protein [Candidatus Wallbacteria bacterium]|nr:helix-hairpin-helix domain-containing protein [Candidatus Wallbacteria bacterium]
MLENMQDIISKSDFIARFIKLPYANKKLAEYLYNAGFKNFEDMKNNDPELIYSLLCIRNNRSFDHNVLSDLKTIIAHME